MGATSTKGVTICMSTGDATPLELTPTAVTKAKPAVVTVADTSALVNADLAKIPIQGTGLESIDDEMFPVNVLDATTFELIGSDTTDDVGNFLAGDPIQVYQQDDMVCPCFSQFEIATETPDTISVATFCDPSASIPAQTTQAGTVAIAGYIDIADPGYEEILQADEDGLTRNFVATLPGNGYLVFPGIISGLGFALPLEGGQGWSATIVLGSKPDHRW